METAQNLNGEILTDHFVYVWNLIEPELRIIANVVAGAKQVLVVTRLGSARLPVFP